MSESTIALIAVAITAVANVVLQVMAHFRVAEVKETLARTTTVVDGKLNELALVASATHILVNSNMAAQLKISAVALRRLADLSRLADLPQYADDLAAAELAERLLHEHNAKQSIVDSQENGGQHTP